MYIVHCILAIIGSDNIVSGRSFLHASCGSTNAWIISNIRMQSVGMQFANNAHVKCNATSTRQRVTNTHTLTRTHLHTHTLTEIFHGEYPKQNKACQKVNKAINNALK